MCNIITMAKHNEIGTIGEEIACRYLMKNGFVIKGQNYLKKWGEIDIIALAPRSIWKSDFHNIKSAEQNFVSCETNNDEKILHFIEVKSVSCEMPDNFSHETLERIRPEENVHGNKVKRLKRAIQSYLAEKHVSPETEWEFSIMAVFVDRERKKAAVRVTPNVVL